MLMVFGHVYSDTKEKFEVLVNALQEQGFEVAYDSGTNATVIKEVVDEEVADE